jgi:hypothetical protein
MTQTTYQARLATPPAVYQKAYAYIVELVDGTRPIFSTTVTGIDKRTTPKTVWKTVGKTVTQHWWGSSEKLHQEPVHTEDVWLIRCSCNSTLEMEEYCRHTIYPLLKEANGKLFPRDDSFMTTTNIQATTEQLMGLSEGQIIHVYPVIFKSSDEWCIGWKLVQQ